MLRLLLPLLAGLAALAAGVGAGLMLKAPVGVVTPHDAPPPDPATADVQAAAFMEFSSQFLIPLMRGAQDGGMIVLDLSLQATTESAAAAQAMEPRLRDAFLKVLFDHANAGGFDDVFTQADRRNAVRRALLEAAQALLGRGVTDVLITDMMRQAPRR